MANGRLIIMRHGQTQYNIERRMTGHTDVPLTEEGKNQARRAGHVLRHYPIDIAYASPLQRARQTMELALTSANAHDNLRGDNKDWKIEERYDLIEKDVGDFAGRCHATCPEVRSHGRFYDKALPNGESDKDVVDRIQRFYQEEIKPLLDEGKTIVISCHSVVKRAFHVALGDLSPENMFKVDMHNAQPWVIDFQEGKKIGSIYINPVDFNPEKIYPSKDFKRPPKFG